MDTALRFSTDGLSEVTIGTFFRRASEQSAAAARAVMEAEYGRRVRFVPTDPYADDATHVDAAEMTFALSIGGDGTFLRAAQAVCGSAVPIFGINTGRLGFFASGTPQNAPQEVRAILSGDGRLAERPMLRGTAYRDGSTTGTVMAMNEVALLKDSPSQPIEVSVTAGGERLYRVLADGLIVSTPTGSTGYALSSGGPIVHPAVRCLIVLPICPHSLYIRPMVLDAARAIEMTLIAGSGSVSLSGDGQQSVAMEPGDTARVEVDPDRSVRMIRLDDASYCDILRSKFDWGSNGPRDMTER